MILSKQKWKQNDKNNTHFLHLSFSIYWYESACNLFSYNYEKNITLYLCVWKKDPYQAALCRAFINKRNVHPIHLQKNIKFYTLNTFFRKKSLMFSVRIKYHNLWLRYATYTKHRWPPIHLNLHKTAFLFYWKAFAPYIILR